MVIVVGDASSVGKIDVLLRQETDDTTPLQLKLEAIARDIGMFGLISAILIVSVLLIRFAAERVIIIIFLWLIINRFMRTTGIMMNTGVKCLIFLSSVSQW